MLCSSELGFWVLQSSVLTYCISLACVSLFPLCEFFGWFSCLSVFICVCAYSGVWWQLQGWVYRANPLTWVSLSLWQQPEVHLDNWSELWQHCQVIQFAENDKTCICIYIFAIVVLKKAGVAINTFLNVFKIFWLRRAIIYHIVLSIITHQKIGKCEKK